ncbi:MAG: hypothetical protein E7470_08985 [Ruminococcaceae bacterium]|nr:hypothetical protein [Oscillospiraceae bacterium]
MKLNLKPSLLPALTLSGGLLTMLLRMWIYGIGTDDRGLLRVGTFPDVVSWIFVAVLFAMLFIGTQELNEATKYSFNFPASLHAVIGTGLAALGIFITSLVELLSGAERLGVFSSVLGLIAAAALGFIAYCRKGGMKPNLLFHSFVCIYLMFHLIANYRIWSAYPQLQTYVFELLAIVFVMLSCYQRAAFDAGHGNRKAYTFHGLAALFFCVAAIPGSANASFYIGCAAWMFTTPCSLKPLRKQPKKDEA